MRRTSQQDPCLPLPALMTETRPDDAEHNVELLTFDRVITASKKLSKADSAAEDTDAKKQALGRRGGTDMFKTVAALKHFSLNDVEGATVKFWRILHDTPAALRGADARTALINWLGMLSTAHPSPRSGDGACGCTRPHCRPLEDLGCCEPKQMCERVCFHQCRCREDVKTLLRDVEATYWTEGSEKPDPELLEQPLCPGSSFKARGGVVGGLL